MTSGLSGLTYLRTINDVFYDQIKVADQKATLIMSIILLMIVWSPDVRQAFLRPVEADFGSSFAWAASVFVTLTLCVALLSGLWVILPRRRRGEGPLFWGGWPGAKATALELAETDDPSAVAKSFADNAEHLAAICRQKSLFVSISLWALILAIAGHVCFMLTR